MDVPMIKGVQKKPNRIVLVISWLYKHLGKKPRGLSKSPVHADLEKVLNFIPST